MGVLIAKYLQNHDDEVLLNSLKKVHKIRTKTTLFASKQARCSMTTITIIPFTRLYNYPWFSLFYIELYKLFRDKNMLEIAYKIMLFLQSRR